MGKTFNAVSHLGAKQSTRCGGPAWRKTCEQNSFCVGVVCQIQSIVHLVQTKKNCLVFKSSCRSKHSKD